jgi:hypothetical protein
MFNRRLATFLLGIWIGCCLLVDAQALQQNRVASRVVDNPTEPARALIQAAGAEPAGQLLRHAAGEQVRSTLAGWEQMQGVIAAAMLVLLIVTDQRKPIAIGLCALMAALVAAQHFVIGPEWASLGRELDFLAEQASFSMASRNWTLTQMYGAAEVVKLLAGGALASYFFAMESVVKRRKSRSRADEDVNVSLGKASF